MKSSVRMATCCTILATAVVRGLSADTSQSSWQVPSDAQVIGYLLQSVNWYRHVYTQRQVASDPGDLIFLNGNQAIEGQMVKLSFEFAKADAALAKGGHFSAAGGGWMMSAVRRTVGWSFLSKRSQCGHLKKMASQFFAERPGFPRIWFCIAAGTITALASSAIRGTSQRS
jgi:hypothetical protein